MSAAEARTMVRRKEFLQLYASDTGLDADSLAVRLMLSSARILDLLSGRAPISNELATHIEEMLQLPASWLDQGGTLEPGAPPMIDASAQAPSIATEAQPAAPVAQPGVVVQPTAVADKKQIHEHRRVNLTMLTAERGSKNRLAQLAGTSGSRISLMTSARKPVSDPFAFAIEDGLGLPRGWLDQPRSPDSIPTSVWQSLKVDGTAPSATSGPLIATPTATPAGPGRPRQPAATQRATSGAAVVPTTIGSAVTSAAAITEASSASAPAPTTSAPTAPTQPAPVSLPASGTGLFDKPAGQCGPIAEALAKTVLNLSATDKLSEARALQLLGILISETSTSR